MAPTTYTDVLARNIRAARSRLGLSQMDAVGRMRALGFTAWHRPTMGNVERGERALRADEILALAICLETDVPRLMVPLREDEWIELPSGLALRVDAVDAYVTGGRLTDERVLWFKNTPVRNPRPGDYPIEETELQPVVAAIVTSELGVLVGRRNDGKPPWTFIAGEQDVVRDDRPENTAVREVKEETGLEVEAGDVIGERIHPKTGRTMIYIAASPVRGTDVFVGDEEELAEVRWVSLAELDELMGAGNVFGPVHEHLARELGEG